VVQRIEQQRSIYGHRISADLSNLSSSTVISSTLTPVGFGPLERPSLGSRRQRLAFVQSSSSASSLISDAPAFWQWFWRSFATVGPGARQRSPLAGRPLSLSSLAEWYSDREARDGAQGNSGTRSRPEGPARLAEFWREVLDYRDYYTDANLAVLVPKEGIASPSTDAYCRQNCRQSRNTALGGP
jgi:hypothetical protein